MQTPEEKTAFWTSMDKRRAAFYRESTDRVKKYFAAELKAVKRAYRSAGAKGINKAVDEQSAELAKVLESIDADVIKAFGVATFEQLKGEAEALEIKILKGVFNFFAQAVQKWIAANVANKVVMISDYTKTLIKGVISTGEAAGEGIDEIAKRIDALYLDQIIPKRSTVIARTEVISSSNAANRFAAKQTELNLNKEWISTPDEKTRDEDDLFNHKDMDSVVVGMDEPYKVPMKGGGHEEIMFPGDPNGSAANVIQCRCTEGYIVKK